MKVVFVVEEIDTQFGTWEYNQDQEVFQVEYKGFIFMIQVNELPNLYPMYLEGKQVYHIYGKDICEVQQKLVDLKATIVEKMEKALCWGMK